MRYLLPLLIVMFMSPLSISAQSEPVTAIPVDGSTQKLLWSSNLSDLILINDLGMLQTVRADTGEIILSETVSLDVATSPLWTIRGVNGASPELIAARTDDGVLLLPYFGSPAQETLSMSSADVTAMAWSPGWAPPPRRGATERYAIAVASADGTISLWAVGWQTSKPEVIQTWQAHDHAVTGLAWSADAQYLASAEDGLIRIWQQPTPMSDFTLMHEIQVDSPVSVPSVWSPVGGQLAVGLEDGQIIVYSIDDALTARKSVVHEAAITALVWSALGHEVAAGDLSGRLSVWDMRADETSPTVFAAHEGAVRQLAFTGPTAIDLPGLPKLASSGDDGKVYIWSISHDG